MENRAVTFYHHGSIGIEGVGYLNVEISGVVLLTVGADVAEGYRGLVSVAHSVNSPYTLIKAESAAKRFCSYSAELQIPLRKLRSLAG